MISYICYVKDYKLGLSVLVVAILATAAVAEMANNYAINTSTYLVNQTGFTLYYFKMDPGNGTSTCSGGCVTLWPPFYAKNVTVPTGLNASDFTSITRKDSMKQTAFKGWPLYHYSKDMMSGDVKGLGFKGIWFVVDPMKFPPK